MSTSRISGRDDPQGEPADAHRTMKRVKAGVTDPGGLSAREFGLLYLYYPTFLPDVAATVDSCPACDGALRREGDCPICIVCGWSRCGGGRG